jgi:hypothetical protein
LNDPDRLSLLAEPKPEDRQRAKHHRLHGEDYGQQVDGQEAEQKGAAPWTNWPSKAMGAADREKF